MSVPDVTLGFTTFRPETAPFAARAMAAARVVILEEPRTPGFSEMLAGELDVADQQSESLLAARVAVYNKLIAKEEMGGVEGENPHLDNEAAVIGFVSALSHEECRELWARIRLLPTRLALEAVRLAGQ